ncbi:alcohol dehydrogenase-like regulatory protein ErcA [Sulfurospirillum diekertiae]|uniref:Alcohol dehydrogenase 2 n=1 Tax=Sulfurospirillum diekertiae TaxID=1854492 RepID=A0A1Y0HLF8_9BACT|nr:alcohol dehydrogenase-like regulatory protein ErcA [Sulfurospirillum diekertiae]ARU48426.1 Alcohol dehydrogenase 2 [Sulfurospirillum diekertiae]ASC93260.1 Alcohol dehydrogenase 2 [Sulfurospirillum diekertiae]
MIKHIELSLRKCVAPEFVFGVDARKMAGKYAKNLGIKKVLIVTDPGVIRAGWVDDVTKALEAENISAILFDDVVPNPRDTNVLAGVKLYRKHKCDGIVTIGGGSPMDCAKGIGIVVANMGDVLAYEGVDKILYPLPPLICIPTTAGTAADVSQFAIINDIKRHVKIAIISKSIVPDVSLIDPETTMSMDKELTINTGLDALTHAVEAYVSNANSAITDLYSLEAISLLGKNLPRVVEHPNDIQARASVMMASLLAGLAFSNASLGVIHAMAHSLGGWLDLPHGLCNAILLEHAVAYNFSHAKERYQTMASYMGMKGNLNCDAIVYDIHEFKLSLGLTQRLGVLGVTREIIPHLASMALQDACIVTNPVMPSQHDVEEILIHAL